MPTAKKVEVVKDVENKLADSMAVYVVEYQGIDVEKLTNLRRDFREAESEFRVVKNTLSRIAANSSGKEGLLSFLSGPVALIFCDEDPIPAAKVLKEFNKENKDLIKIKGGLVEGQVVSPEQIKEVADIPPREQLLAQLLGALQSPVSGFAGVLNGVARNFVGVLDAIAKEKEKSN